MKIKQCLECGKEFTPRNGFQKYCEGPHTSVCVVCNREFEYTSRPSEKPKTCSRKCQTELQHRTSKEKYGVDNVSQIPGVYDTSKKTVEPKTVKQKVRICKWCGKEFTGYGTALYCEGPHYSTCEACGKQFEVNPRQPNRACSPECKQVLIQQDLAKQIRVCEECGKEFHPTSSMSRYCLGPHYKPCVICGTLVEYQPGSASTDVNCCSVECSNELRRRTSNKLYGVDFPTQRPEAKEAAKQQAIESSEDRKNTCFAKYGYDNVAKVPEVKAKISATVKSEECQAKIRATSIQHLGVPFAAQSREVQQKRAETRKSYTALDGVHVDSSYELLVYDFCLRNNIQFTYQPVSFEYEYEGKKHITHIDFEIDGMLFEVKGGHLLHGTFEEASVPIAVKLDTYKKHQVVVITDTEGSSVFGRPNSHESNGFKYQNKCPNPLIGVDIQLFDNPEFPYRDDRPKCFYDVKVDGKLSSFEAFQDESIRWEMIKNRVQYSGGFINAKQVLTAMNVTRTCKQPSWFSKSLARRVIQTYCTSDIIVDPMAGWGARADAANALHKTYIGCDLNSELVKWHHQNGRTNISCCDAHEFKFDDVCSVFICPPYSDPKTGRCFEDYNFEGFDESAKTLTQCQWLQIVMQNVPNAKEYVLVCKIVDVGWEKYIVETINNTSHFGKNNEYILVVPNTQI